MLVTGLLATSAILMPTSIASAATSGPPDLTSITLSDSSLVAGDPATVPADTHAARYALQEIRLRDSVGNEIRYYRAGTAIQYPGAITGTHAITMGTMDLTVGYLPSAPSIEAVRARSGSAVVFWGAPPSDGTPVSRYTITSQPGDRTVTTSGSADQVEVTGLTNGTTYRFTVTATDAFGTGLASLLSVSVTPKMSSNIMATGDIRSPDVMTVQDNGYLTLAPNNGHGGFATSATQRYIGPGWGTFLSVFSPGDFTGDRKSDVMAINSAGELLLYRGNGLGGWAGGGLKIGSGWSIFR